MWNNRSCLALAVCLALGGVARAQAPDQALEKTPVSPAPVVPPVRTRLPVPTAPGLSFSKGLPDTAQGPAPYPDNPDLPPLPPPPPPAPLPAPEPQMIGDPFSPFALVPFSKQVLVSGARGPGLISTAQLHAAVPVPVLGPALFKVADNESPRPLDRVFFNFAFVNDPIDTAFTPGGAPLPPAQALSGLGPTLGRSTLPGLHIFDRPFNRSTDAALLVDPTQQFLGAFGFEKTFLHGDASVGLRAPVVGLAGDGSLRQSDFGDLSLVFKYALLNGGPGGNVLSTGLVMTTPNGPAVRLAEGGSPLNPTLFQPYLAGLWTSGRFYAQGFTSLAVPTDFREPAVWFNDVGAGYAVYNNPASCFLTALTPTLELHLNTPLGHEGFGGAPLTVPDSLTLTGGMHFLFFNRVRFTAGAATPLTGPHPYDFAAFAQLNVLF